MATATHGTCEDTGKAIYYSKRAARRDLRTHLAKASIRLYQCPHHPGHLHLTREWKRS